MSASDPPSPIALNYATPGADQSVCLYRTEHGGTIVIYEPGRKWRVMSEMVSLLVGLVCLSTCLAGCALRGGPAEMFLALAGAVVFIRALTSRWTNRPDWKEPALIEVTLEEVRFLNFTTRTPRVLQRAMIYEVIGHVDLRMLAVRIRGSPTIGFELALPAAKIQEVAEMLRSILGLKEERQAKG